MKTANATLANLDEFTRAYIDCMLWTKEDRLKEDADQHESEYEPAARWDVNMHCLAPETLDRIIADCEKFQNENVIAPHFKEAGHDFWLTRNGHGAGFWDGDWPDSGEELTVASKSFGQCDLYFGDDGKLYVA